MCVCVLWNSVLQNYCSHLQFQKLKSVKELGDTNAVRRAYTCLANTYLCAGEYQSAIDCYMCVSAGRETECIFCLI